MQSEVQSIEQLLMYLVSCVFALFSLLVQYHNRNVVFAIKFLVFQEK